MCQLVFLAPVSPPSPSPTCPRAVFSGSPGLGPEHPSHVPQESRTDSDTLPEKQLTPVLSQPRALPRLWSVSVVGGAGPKAPAPPQPKASHRVRHKARRLPTMDLVQPGNPEGQGARRPDQPRRAKASFNAHSPENKNRNAFMELVTALHILTHFIPQQPYEVGTNCIPTLEMGVLRWQEVKGQRQDLNSRAVGCGVYDITLLITANQTLISLSLTAPHRITASLVHS